MSWRWATKRVPCQAHTCVRQLGSCAPPCTCHPPTPTPLPRASGHVPRHGAHAQARPAAQRLFRLHAGCTERQGRAIRVAQQQGRALHCGIPPPRVVGAKLGCVRAPAGSRVTQGLCACAHATPLHRTWCCPADWSLGLPAGEEAECVAAGASFCAVATSRRTLRLFTPAGLQVSYLTGRHARERTASSLSAPAPRQRRAHADG